MLENEKIVETSPVGPYLHEARKSFKTIREAIEAACRNSYSLGESDIGIFWNISSIKEAAEVIDEYYEENHGSYNLPSISTEFTYDALEDGILESSNDEERLPNSICYLTSTGINELIIRAEVDDKGNPSYTAIYSVKSQKLLQQSSAIQAFSKDGWDCRCIKARRKELHKVDGNIFNPNNLLNSGRFAYMLDSELSPEVIEEIEALKSAVVADGEFSFNEDNEGAMIRHVFEKYGNVTPLERVVFGDSKHSYKLPDEITGTILEGFVWAKSGGVYVNDIDMHIRKIEPIASTYEWNEYISECPPSEESLRAMDEEAIKSGIELWIDTNKQLAITEKIKAESGSHKEMHTPQEIAAGISPKQSDIEKVLEETTKGVNSQNQEGKTQVDEEFIID